jgi:hypothetical protein
MSFSCRRRCTVSAACRYSDIQALGAGIDAFVEGFGVFNILASRVLHDVEGALRSIEVAYHMNHGRRGEPLIDHATGLMKEGIGHYRVRRDGERQLVIECENPYPCDLDRGIVETVAKRFQPDATVVHAAKAPCRKQGANACALVVEW